MEAVQYYTLVKDETGAGWLVAEVEDEPENGRYPLSERIVPGPHV